MSLLPFFARDLGVDDADRRPRRSAPMRSASWSARRCSTVLGARMPRRTLLIALMALFARRQRPVARWRPSYRAMLAFRFLSRAAARRLFRRSRRSSPPRWSRRTSARRRSARVMLGLTVATDRRRAARQPGSARRSAGARCFARRRRAARSLTAALVPVLAPRDRPRRRREPACANWRRCAAAAGVADARRSARSASAGCSRSTPISPSTLRRGDAASPGARCRSCSPRSASA